MTAFVTSLRLLFHTVQSSPRFTRPLQNTCQRNPKKAWTSNKQQYLEFSLFPGFRGLTRDPFIPCFFKDPDSAARDQALTGYLPFRRIFSKLRQYLFV
jgi:hypothetical protein